MTFKVPKGTPAIAFYLDNSRKTQTGAPKLVWIENFTHTTRMVEFGYNVPIFNFQCRENVDTVLSHMIGDFSDYQCFESGNWFLYVFKMYVTIR